MKDISKRVTSFLDDYPEYQGNPELLEKMIGQSNLPEKLDLYKKLAEMQADCGTK